MHVTTVCAPRSIGRHIKAICKSSRYCAKTCGPSAEDNGGRTPLRMAVIGQQAAVEKVLRDYGATL